MHEDLLNKEFNFVFQHFDDVREEYQWKCTTVEFGTDDPAIYGLGKTKIEALFDLIDTIIQYNDIIKNFSKNMEKKYGKNKNRVRG